MSFFRLFFDAKNRFFLLSIFVLFCSQIFVFFCLKKSKKSAAKNRKKKRLKNRKKIRTRAARRGSNPSPCIFFSKFFHASRRRAGPEPVELGSKPRANKCLWFFGNVKIRGWVHRLRILPSQ